MKRLLSLTILVSAFLTSCATRTSLIEQYLQPCRIEGKHASLDAVIADPASTTDDLYHFGGNAEDALERCNDDKESIKRLQEGKR